MTGSSGSSGSDLTDKETASANGTLRASKAIFSERGPATLWRRLARSVLFLPSQTSRSFHRVEESCIASATCAAVTTSSGERNQPVPAMPARPGPNLRSSALKLREMLTVVLLRADGSMHAALADGKTATSAPMTSNKRHLATLRVLCCDLTEPRKIDICGSSYRFPNKLVAFERARATGSKANAQGKDCRAHFSVAVQFLHAALVPKSKRICLYVFDIRNDLLVLNETPQMRSRCAYASCGFSGYVF